MANGVRAVAVGVVMELVALLIFFETAAGGHGTYATAKCLFPYWLVVAALAQTVNTPMFLLALLQFPGYALIVVANRKRLWVPWVLVAVHLVAVVAAFLLENPNTTP